MSRLEKLALQIRTAFPPGVFLGAVTNGCGCEECTELESSLSLRAWDQLDEKTMDVHFGGLSLLTNQAWAAFLPAWLMLSLGRLDEKEQKFREWTLLNLALYVDDESDSREEENFTTDRLRALAASVRPDQAAAIGEFLRFLYSEAALGAWDRESIERALHTIWEKSQFAAEAN